MPVLFRWRASRRWRILSILGIASLLVVQLSSEVWDALTLLPALAGGAFWIFYTAYAIIAFLFLGVGSLVWLYGFRRQPTVSALLFVFCSVMMLAFGSLSAPAVGNALLINVGSSCTALAVLCLLLLLLRFPVDTYAQVKAQRGRYRILLTSLVGILTLCLFAVARDVLNVADPGWLNFLSELYYGLTGAACIGAVIYATRHASSMRTQQQTRLFFVGTLLSFMPILVLTIIPSLLNLHSAVDGTLSMLSLVFFPLSLGYALLRYQVLIFDTYIRKTVTRIVGSVCLALLAYALFAVGSLLVANSVSLFLACLIAVGVVCAPLIWWAAAWLTERYFFPEARYYERMLKQAQETQQAQMQETFNLKLIAQSLALDIMTTLKAPEACLFFLDEETQSYTLVSPYRGEEREERLRSLVLEPLAATLSLSEQNGHTAIAMTSPLAAQLRQARRPLLLNEAVPREQVQRNGLTRYLSSHIPHEDGLDLLLAPVHTLQGHLIGVLVVGERGDHQHYAGPELEALQHLVHASSGALETARLYEVATRQLQRSTHEVEQAYEQQRRLNTIKDELIIHMNHELRTPLSEVAGYLDLLGEHTASLDPSLQVLFVQKATHGCDELLQLVDTMLDAAQVGAVETPPPCTVVALAEVVQKEVDSLSPTTIGTHHILVQGMEPVVAWANAQSLLHIVRNLLSNALKYSPADTTITLSATVNEDSVYLCVKDEGAGIPPEEMSLLFGKFVRLQRDMSGSIRGTGLGLYISKQLVEAMDGRIWAESSGILGEGSRFYVRLPAAHSRTTTSPPTPGVCDLIVA